MALELPQSIFLHAAKTGGTWVRAAVTAAGITASELGGFHSGAVSNPTNKLVFTFVRNPVDWYISYWRCPHHRQRILEGKNVFLHDARTAKEATDFSVWVQRVAEDARKFRRAGRHLFSDYVRPAKFVGRAEQLVIDLCDVLQRAGEKFDQRAIHKLSARNTSQYEPPILTHATIDEILALEKAAFLEFRYPVEPAHYVSNSAV